MTWVYQTNQFEQNEAYGKYVAKLLQKANEARQDYLKLSPENQKRFAVETRDLLHTATAADALEQLISKGFY